MDILSILTGPLLGGLGGAATAITTRILDYKDAGAKREFDLAMRDKDLEHLKVELANQAQIKTVDADMQITLKEFDTQAAAMAADKASYGDSWMARWIIDPLRGIIRPAATIVLGSWLGWLTYQSVTVGPKISMELQMQIVETMLTLATGAVSYWFGMRGTKRSR